MNAEVDATVLEDRLAALEAARSWSPRVVSRFESRIRDADDLDLFRVNPIAYASRGGVSEAEAIDLFLFAAKVGLFDMEWNIVCASCGNMARSFRTLENIDPHFACSVCQMEKDVSFDEYIQVSFTVSPSVRAIAYHDPSSLTAEDLYFRWHFSRDIRPTFGGRTFPEFLKEATFFVGYVEPGQTIESDRALTGAFLAVRDVLHLATVMYEVGEGTDSVVRIDLTLKDGRFVDAERDLEPMIFQFENAPDLRFRFPGSATIPRGDASLRIENGMSERASVWVMEYPEVPKLHQAIEFEPVLTARRVLSTQTFRNLFRSQTLPASEGLAVADMTFMFTDLRDSTKLYDLIGDATAYNLVRLHFDALESVISEHGGALVKTIGDAIMATFIDAAAGVRAAIVMSERMSEFSRSASADLVLKIGMHRGHAIAVTSNEQMDYFGQTVNVAARIQGLAAPGELCLSDDVYRADGVEALLTGRSVERESSVMKGVAEEIPVYRVPLGP